MTKKSKRRALKTGNRTSEGPRNTTVVCGIDINKDGDVNLPTLEIEEEETDNNNIIPRKKMSRWQRKCLEDKKRQESLEAYQKENSKRCMYPIDLWFLLAEKIKPEQVKVFSLICKGAYQVTTTRKFWLNLYKRYSSDNNLPGHLKPKAITTSIGLKTRVIRSLFYSYVPFVDRIAHFTLTSIPMEQVECKTCQCYWWKQAISSKQNTHVWILYLKLVPPEKCTSKTNVFQVTDLITYNPEEGCFLLRITATSFVNIQDITEMYLKSGSVGVGRDFLHHKVKLTFYEYRKNGLYINHQASILTIDPVLDVFILPWWNPEYPHPLDN